jgi:hypothetical protein
VEPNSKISNSLDEIFPFISLFAFNLIFLSSRKNEVMDCKHIHGFHNFIFEMGHKTERKFRAEIYWIFEMVQ